jgi:hypothetical protein
MEIGKPEEENGWLWSFGIETWVNEAAEYNRQKYGETDRRILSIGLGPISFGWDWPIKQRDRKRTGADNG